MTADDTILRCRDRPQEVTVKVSHNLDSLALLPSLHRQLSVCDLSVLCGIQPLFKAMPDLDRGSRHCGYLSLII